VRYRRALSLDPAKCGIYNPPVLSLTNTPQKRNLLIRQIQHLGLGGLAAALLENGGAFASLAAQGLYVAEPLLASWTPGQSMREFAAMLEDPQQRAQLADALREPNK